MKSKLIGTFDMSGLVKLKPLHIAVAAVCGSLSLSTLAEGLALEEIVVTAQKRSESQQKVPIAVDLFSAAAVKNRQISGVADLAVNTPSLRYGEAAGSSQISVRGVGFGLVTGSGENSVAVHTDGLYLGNPGAVQMLQDDIGGIELLRGPQGTLWGRNATGGVVNFKTPGPEEEFGGSVKVGFGNYGAKSVSANISVPVSDIVKTRFSISHLDRDGAYDNLLTGNEVGETDKIGGRFSIDITPTDDLEIQGRFFYSEEDFGGPINGPIDGSVEVNPLYAGLPYSLDPYEVTHAFDPLMESELAGGSIRVDYDINEAWNLVSITGYVDFTRENDYDSAGLPGSFVLLGDGQSGDPVGRDLSDETFTQEFNLTWQGDRSRVLFGAFYLKQEVDILSTVELPALTPLINLIGFAFDFEEEIESTALFVDGILI